MKPYLKSKAAAVTLALLAFCARCIPVAGASEDGVLRSDSLGSNAGRSPRNQVFQFMATVSATNTAGKARQATGYLWISPNCQRVRGVLIAGRNVPEHWLVGHPAIREACADSGLAIVWCCPSFFDANIKEGQYHAGFVQRLLNALAVQPGELKLVPNNKGKPQTITFDPIPDQPASEREVSLRATSDAGLPVQFFVRYGPAEVQGNRLVFTPIPPRSKLPLTVTVAAWQWGRTAEPAIQTAAIVERSFKLISTKRP